MSSEDELTLEQRELNNLLRESNENESQEHAVKGKVGKRASNTHLIDFDPLNNDFNSKENWYLVGTFIIFGIAFAGVILNVMAYNVSMQNHDLLNNYQDSFKSLNLSNWALVCHNSSSPLNPCNAGPPSPDSLFNWQTLTTNHLGTSNTPCAHQTAPYDSPCLEIQNKMKLLPNFTDPSRINFADPNHLFSLSSLVFPNTDTVATGNNQVLDYPYWQQANIRTLPGTRFIMKDKVNLNVQPNNIYAIQLPVIFWSDLTSSLPGSSSTADYCQNPQISDIVDKYPLFMLFNPFLSAKNGTVPTFSICTCLMAPTNNATNPYLWVTACVDGSTFTLST